MASADTGNDEAAKVLVEIASHARWSVGSSAPALAGLTAWVEAYGVAAERTLPLEESDDEVLRGAARMVLAPLGGVDPAAGPTTSSAVRPGVDEAADSVLGGLNRLGERCLAALGERSPLLPPPLAENVTPASPNSGFRCGGAAPKM